jgi:hypothetical protein
MAIAEHPDRAAPSSGSDDVSIAAALQEEAVRLMVREIFANAGSIDTEDDLYEWLARPSPANRLGAS